MQGKNNIRMAILEIYSAWANTVIRRPCSLSENPFYKGKISCKAILLYFCALLVSSFVGFATISARIGFQDFEVDIILGIYLVKSWCIYQKNLSNKLETLWN